LTGKEVNEQDRIATELAEKEKNLVTKDEVAKEMARMRG
jgi:hypothetical protein